jgi:hypothetical protein
MLPKPATTNVIQDTMESYARTVVQKLTDKEVLESLKAQGIGSLEDLVAKSLAGFKAGPVGGGVVARDTFIYTQAVYKTAMPIDKTLIAELTKKIGK